MLGTLGANENKLKTRSETAPFFLSFFLKRLFL